MANTDGAAAVSVAKAELPVAPVAKENWSDTQKILALLYTTSFIVIILLLVLIVSPKTDPQVFTLLTAMLGVLMREQGTIIGYFFGSTKSSVTKDSTILAQAQSANSPAPTTPPTP